MGKLVKTASAVGDAIGVSASRVRQLKNNSTLALCQRADGWWDLEKVLQWDGMRKELGRPPKEGELRGLAVKEMQVEATKAVVDKYRRVKLDVLDNAQAASADAYMAALRELQTRMPEMKPHELINYLGRTAVGFGVFYDKSRLERGKSTENVAMTVALIKEMRKEMRGD